MEITVRPPDDPNFRLIETFGYAPETGIVRLDRHLARMARSAEALGLSFKREAVLEVLRPIAGPQPLRCRLTMDLRGHFDLASTQITPDTRVWRVAISTERLDPDDPWLRHKTTRRAFYDHARATMPEDVDEVVFFNTLGELCEGTITNVFVMLGERWVTPRLSSGVLPGVLREELIEKGEVVEADVSEADFAGARALKLGNSLRGLLKAKMIEGKRSK